MRAVQFTPPPPSIVIGVPLFVCMLQHVYKFAHAHKYEFIHSYHTKVQRKLVNIYICLVLRVYILFAVQMHPLCLICTAIIQTIYRFVYLHTDKKWDAPLWIEKARWTSRPFVLLLLSFLSRNVLHNSMFGSIHPSSIRPAPCVHNFFMTRHAGQHNCTCTCTSCACTVRRCYSAMWIVDVRDSK